jgi:hypothetical protein
MTQVVGRILDVRDVSRPTLPSQQARQEAEMNMAALTSHHHTPSFI